jgi:hypothetical protein
MTTPGARQTSLMSCSADRASSLHCLCAVRTSLRCPKSSRRSFSRFISALTEQALEKLAHVSQVLELDASLVAFVKRQSGEVLAPLHRLAPVSLDQGRRNLGDAREQRCRVLRYPLVPPAAGFEPAPP